MRTHLFGILGLAIFLTLSTVEAKTTIGKVELADRVVEPLIDEPKSEGPHPILVLVADDAGSARDPLFEKLSQTANLDGFVTVRLDWTYKKAKGAPSADLKREAEELGLVVSELIGSRMMKQFEVDPAKVALIAKGFGAKVAMVPEAAATGEKVKATLLLNPACAPAPGSFAKLYAPFLTAKTPRMIIATRAGAGAACPMDQIYGSAKDFGENVSLYALEKDSPGEEGIFGATLLWLRNLGWSEAKIAPKKTARKKIDAKKHAVDAQSAAAHP